MIERLKGYAARYGLPVSVGMGTLAASAPLAHADDLNSLIASSSAGIAGVLGSSPAEAVTWMNTNLLVEFIGAGLAVLYALRWDIVALIALSIIVYFAFRAFGFFRN